MTRHAWQGESTRLAVNMVTMLGSVRVQGLFATPLTIIRRFICDGLVHSVNKRQCASHDLLTRASAASNPA
jgi:hypothetical protein